MADHTTFLSRYHHSTLSLAAVAAGFGLCAIYVAYARRPSPSTLQRSNAVHRPRPRRGHDHGHPTVTWDEPTQDAPMGLVTIRSGVQQIHIGIHDCPSFSLDQLRPLMDVIPNATDDTLQDVQDVALSAALGLSLIAARTNNLPHLLVDLIQRGGTDLISAMVRASDEHVRLHSGQLRQILRANDLPNAQIEQAVAQFLVSDEWRQDHDVEASHPRGVGAPAETAHSAPPASRNGEESGQEFRGLLYYIAEDNARQKAYEHRGIHCEKCKDTIRGVRWHCLNCPDYDLCSACEQNNDHFKTHIFAKIIIPLPVLSQPTKEYRIWYPGSSSMSLGPLDSQLRERLCSGHGFEPPQIDAFYDQFTCIANIIPGLSGSGVAAAIDRRAFDKAFVCEKWPAPFAANAMHDRIWDFYDTDGNGVIDFEEFMSGMAYLRGPNRFASLNRTLRGYDIDNDELLDRADFLRLLRAKYDINKKIVDDMVRGQEMDRPTSISDMSMLRSSQPISSALTESIPRGNVRHPRGKHLNGVGDLQPTKGTKTILDDEDPWPTVGYDDSVQRSQTEQLRHYISIFQEQLHATDARATWHGEADTSPNQLLAEIEALNRKLLHHEGNKESFEEPHVPDLLWEITKDSLNELLDLLFKGREDEENDAVKSRGERKQWRSELYEIAKAEQKAIDERTYGALTDPLLATAAQTYSQRSNMPLASEHDSSATFLSRDIVPTDWESLERREREIPHTPLEQLLDATGYGVRDENDTDTGETSQHIVRSGSSTNSSSTSPTPEITPTRSVAISEGSPGDPTLPQNRPNSSSANKRQPSLRRTGGKSVASSRAETRRSYSPKADPRRLKELARLEVVDRRVHDRGGPGRLTFEEIEARVVADGREELRGLIKSWLEWASF